MNEKQAERPANKNPVPPGASKDKPTRVRGAPSLTGGLALILSLIALVTAGYLWYMLGEKQGLMSSNIVGKVEALSGAVETLKANNTAMAQELASLRETQDAMKTGMAKITTDFASNRNEWLLAEAEQLLLVANNRLQLAQDVPLALAALRAADRQLKQLSNPNLLPVRKQLARDMAKVEALDQVDFDGIALRLGNLAERIDDLPLAVETTFRRPETAAEPTPQAEGGWSRFWRELWQDLGNLVRIRHDADKRRPLLPPEQRYFVRENLRLMLSGAQLALLRRDEGTFQQNLKSARAWLNDYFDVSAPSVARTIEGLDRLIHTALTLDIPDISGSLQALQRFTGKPTGP